MSELRLRADGVHWREIDGEVVALEARSSTYVASNASGALLWRELAAGTTRERLVTALADAYGIDRARGEADVDRFLAELAAQDLLAA